MTPMSKFNKDLIAMMKEELPPITKAIDTPATDQGDKSRGDRGVKNQGDMPPQMLTWEYCIDPRPTWKGEQQIAKHAGIHVYWAREEHRFYRFYLCAGSVIWQRSQAIELFN